MKRIKEIQQTLTRLAEMDEQLENCEEWNIVAQDIVQKLGTIRKECERCTSTNLLTPPDSTSSSSIYSEASSGIDNIYSEAVEAYDQQIYSRCVRLVESANRESPVDMCLISLAHHSYSEMVSAAGSSDDSLKFARWWAEFLDSVEAGRGHSEKIELLEYEGIAYEKIVEILNGSGEYYEKLLEVVRRSYEMVTLFNRPYHLLSIQKLMRLASVIDSEYSRCCDQSILSDAKNSVINAIRNVINDRKKYAKVGKYNEDTIRMCDSHLQQILDFDFIRNDNNMQRSMSLSPIPFDTDNHFVLRL